jgi:hypothetical protein
MNNIIILYTILLIIVIYILASTIENFQTTPPAGPTDQITAAVKQLYLADVESIRNLSTVATNLQRDGGLVTPGNISIKGKLSIGSAGDIKNSLVDLLVENQTAPATITLKTKLDDNNITLTNTEGSFKISNKTGVDLFNINKDDNVMKNGLTTESLTTTGDIIAKGKADITGVLTTGSIVIATPATGTAATGTPATGTPATGTAATGTAATGTTGATGATGARGTAATGTPATGTAATGTPATGTAATGTPATGAKGTIEKFTGTPAAGAVGTTTITPTAITTGSITATEITGPNVRNKARYIVVGNYKRPDLAILSWTLIEIEAYDNTGENVIKNKPAKILTGDKYDTTQYGPNQFGPEKANDGIIFTTPTNMNNTVEHGFHGGKSILQALEYDLVKDYYIDQIVLYNRYYTELTTRMNGTTIELFDANKKLLRTIQTGNWYQKFSKEYLL